MHDGFFDFSGGRGQRTEAFVFRLREGRSLRPIGEINPIMSSGAPRLAHDSGRGSVTRTLSMNLGEDDAREINFVSDVVDVAMIVGDDEYPLGRYRFDDPVRQDYFDPDTDEPRSLVSCQLTDSMSIVDAKTETAFTAVVEQADDVLRRLLEPLGFTVRVEDSSFQINNSWTAGTSRKQIMSATAEMGGYLSPWFDHDGVLRAIRLFDPDIGAPDFDFDAQQSVIAESVTRSNTAATAPNRVVVVGNNGVTYTSSTDAFDPGPLMAFCDVPSTAPHSVMNLGFVRPEIYDRQVSSVAQAQELADTLCLTQTVAETLEVSTALDPRHDGWNTVKFEGRRWLENAWTMQLVAGGEMRHTLQRSYPASPEVLSGVAGAVEVE